MIGAMLALAALLVHLPRPPARKTPSPANTVNGKREGKIQKAYRTAIPYSAGGTASAISATARLQPPTPSTWMGTESNGSDVASRIIHASRIALGHRIHLHRHRRAHRRRHRRHHGLFSSAALTSSACALIEIFEAVPTLILLLTFVAFFRPQPLPQ